MCKNLIKAICTILPAFLLILWSLGANGLTVKDDSLQFEILLTNKMLKEVHLSEKLITSVEITPNRHILLSTNNQFYLLGWGGIAPIGKKVTGIISSYAYTSDKLLLAIHDNELCSFDSLGNPSTLFKLPGYGMGISAGGYVMYLYDRNSGKTKNAVYLIAKGGKYAKLFEIPSPIQSVAEMDNSILVASGSDLFHFDLKSKALKVLVALEKDKKIKSIAVDSTNNRVYFSTENAIYAIKDSSAVTISDDFGGVLRCFNNGLIVFDSEKNLLVRILGIEEKIESKMQTKNTIVDILKSTDTLSNATIINLTKGKISDDIIITIINKYKVNFDLSINSMISLSSQNVSSPVIQAMKNAMKNKTGNSSGNNMIPNNQTNSNSNTVNTNINQVKKYYIIAGSYPSEQKANEAVTVLKSVGFPDAEVVGKSDSGSYRIAYKGYDTNEEAVKYLAKIKQTENPSAWIFEK